MITESKVNVQVWATTKVAPENSMAARWAKARAVNPSNQSLVPRTHVTVRWVVVPGSEGEDRRSPE